MCTGESLVVESPVNEIEPEPVIDFQSRKVTLQDLLQNAGVAELLDAKQSVEELLSVRINREYETMRANANAIAQATNQPIESVLEKLAPKRVRKLTVVETPKPERVKYRHPENSELTWSGRGKQPFWLRDALTQYDEQDLLAA